MQLFLDTANVEEIREIAAWGILSGVTTNPSLIAREGRDFREVINRLIFQSGDSFPKCTEKPASE